MKRLLHILTILTGTCSLWAQDTKLTGTIIGTVGSVDYSNNSSYSTTQNTREMAFDGRTDTYFASWERSYTWVGLDLGKPHIITQVGWSPRNDGVGPERVRLAIFEGANQPDFSDAIPLYMVKQNGTIGVIDHGQVDVSLGVRYVRYVSPGNARCNVAEVEFWGHTGIGDSSQLYQVTNLPTVCIHTENAQEPYDKLHQIPGIASIISQNGTHLLQDSVYTRLRGNASMQFPKKPYQIKFSKKHHALPGSPAKAKKWTLINNYGDKTLMRNLVAYHMDKQLGAIYSPFAEPVDVIVNGEYKGCYQLSDKVEIGKGRIEIDEMDETCISGEALTGGYLLEMDGYYADEPTAFVSSRNIPITIQSPDEDILTNTQKSYIKNQYTDLENTVFGNTYTHPTDGYRSKMDLRSFLIQFLSNQLAANPDNYWSTYFYKPKNDYFYFGPVWDFDIAFDNDYRQSNPNDRSDWIYGSANNAAAFPRRIMTDGGAIQNMRMIYATARDKDLISQAHMGAYIDSMAIVLDESQRLNFYRWPILSQNVHMNKTARGSYAAEVAYLREWVLKRVAWVDKKLSYVAGMSQTNTEETEAEWQNGMPFAVYDMTGMLIYEGTEWPELQHGVYLVRQGKLTRKVIE